MENSKAKPDGQRGIRSVRLYVRDFERINQHYEIQVTESYPNETVILTSQRAHKPEDAVKLLQACGISPYEINVAGTELAKNDHNVAHFGISKRFLFSKFEGVAS